MDEEDSIRKAYVSTFVTKDQAAQKADEWQLNKEKVVKFLIGSRGNHETISSFLAQAVVEKQGDLALELLNVLSAKDLRDISLEVLEDHLYNSLLPKDLTLEAYKEILNPRVENEMLTAYKG